MQEKVTKIFEKHCSKKVILKQEKTNLDIDLRKDDISLRKDVIELRKEDIRLRKGIEQRKKDVETKKLNSSYARRH